MTHLLLLLILSSWQIFKAQNVGINFIEIPQDNRDQVACTAALLGKYFYSGETLSGSVLYMSITTASAHLQQTLLHAIHSNPHYPWTIVVQNTQRDSEMQVKIQHVLHEKPQCYFLILENIEDENMDEIFESWKTNLNWNPLAQFVVYFATIEETEEEMTDIMVEILLTFMNEKIYNVNIIGKSEESSFYFAKTVFPYHPDNHCGNRVITVETLDICECREREIAKFEKVKEKEIDEGLEVIEKGQSKERENKAIDENSCNDNKQQEREDVVDEEENENYFYNATKETFSPTTEISTFEKTSLNSIYVNNSKDVVLEHKNDTDSLVHFRFLKLSIKEIHRGLFFDKFPKDLNGCPLVAAYRSWEPYIFNEDLDNSLYSSISKEKEENNPTFDNSPYFKEGEVYEDDGIGDNGADDYGVYNKNEDMDAESEGALAEIRLNGIEYKMLQTIGERLHISIEMQVENNNLYHLFQQLIDGDIEIIVGGIDEDPSISQFVSSTIPYHQDDLTWCVAKAKDTYNLLNFMATFQIDVWLLTFLFMLIASLNILMSQKCLKLHLDFLESYLDINVYVMGIILSQAISLRPIPTSLKLCFGTTFFMAFMFSNIYQSFLVSTLTTMKTSYQISHLNEIYQNRMHIVGSVENVRHLSKAGQFYRYVREQFQMCYNIEECLQQAAEDTKLAVIVSRQHFSYNPRIPHDRLYCFDRNENIYVLLVTMLMPKKFHLLHKINPVIQHIIESGHMQKWARDLELRRKINKDIQRARKKQFKSLTLSQVAGTFAFNGLLLAFALWMFVLERAVHWLAVKRSTRLKLVKYIHKKFTRKCSKEG